MSPYLYLLGFVSVLALSVAGIVAYYAHGARVLQPRKRKKALRQDATYYGNAEPHHVEELKKELPAENPHELARMLKHMRPAVRIAAAEMLLAMVAELTLEERIKLTIDLERLLKDLDEDTSGKAFNKLYATIVADAKAKLGQVHRLYDPVHYCRAHIVKVEGPLGHVAASRAALEDRHLRVVRRAVGYLGQREAGLKTEDLFIDLWDRARGAIRPAEMEELHLYEAWDGFNWDWAINALVEMVHNRLGAEARLPVRVMDGVALSANSERLLGSIRG